MDCNRTKLFVGRNENPRETIKISSVYPLKNFLSLKHHQLESSRISTKNKAEQFLNEFATAFLVAAAFGKDYFVDLAGIY